VEQVLKIRAVNENDMELIKTIHNKFYKDEFELPEDHYLGAFLIEDNYEYITAGGVRTIPELIAVTNKDCSSRKRFEALKFLLQASSLACSNNGYEHIHAFVQDENWYNQLIKHGFHTTKGKALIYG